MTEVSTGTVRLVPHPAEQEGTTMMMVTEYQVKRFMTKAETAEMMAVFAEAGTGPGEIAHYVALDGAHGWVVSDSDDAGALYANTLKFTEWVDFKSSVVLRADDAVPHILTALAE
jgi:hypothetical protein